MKKTNKPHPLKVFNDNNAKARMKAGGEMAKFRKSLPQKGDGGRWHAPMVLPENPKTQSSVEGPMNNPMIAPADTMRVEQISPADALRKYNNYGAPVMRKPPGVREGFTPEEMRRFNATPIKNKKGGAVRRKKK